MKIAKFLNALCGLMMLIFTVIEFVTGHIDRATLFAVMVLWFMPTDKE